MYVQKSENYNLLGLYDANVKGESTVLSQGREHDRKIQFWEDPQTHATHITPRARAKSENKRFFFSVNMKDHLKF